MIQTCAYESSLSLQYCTAQLHSAALAVAIGLGGQLDIDFSEKCALKFSEIFPRAVTYLRAGAVYVTWDDFLPHTPTLHGESKYEACVPRDRL